MEEKNQNHKSSDHSNDDSQARSGLRDYMKYAGLGFQMLAIIGIFAWAGIKLDQRSGNESKLYTAILSLVGVIIGIYTALKDFIGKNE